MRILNGIPASFGFADGPCYVYCPTEVHYDNEKVEDLEHEWQRLETAIQVAKAQIEALYQKAEQEIGAKEAAIFKAHALFLDDSELLSSTKENIQKASCSAEAAWDDAVEKFATKLEGLEDEYFRERAADLRDVGARVLRQLTGQEESDLSSLSCPSIVVAKDLTPSDTVQFDKFLVLGFCTAEGGPTSHTAILAKALDLPAVVGVGQDIMHVQSGMPALLDGDRGEFILHPEASDRQAFEERKLKAEKIATEELALAQQAAITLDGVQVEVVANVGAPADAQIALDRGAEGIGLLRTEFLCLDHESAPTEDEHLDAYLSILNCMQERPVVIRTFDIGGDKQLPFIDFGKETNPFLGWRAIRMCLDTPGLFRTQLRGLLRASPGHDLRIMFPMIATLEELRSAKNILEDVHSEILEEGHLIADVIQVGIMVEVPSAALLADELSKEVDFFSIGTNDLTQYTLAAERTNEKVAHLGDPCHPAVLRLIHMTVKAAHASDIWVGLCGEMGGDPTAIPILLGLGVDELSMAPSAIPRAKAILRQLSKHKAQALAMAALQLTSAQEVRELVRNSHLG
jgi:phosphoenolpyruvate-protein phosphotransferase